MKLGDGLSSLNKGEGSVQEHLARAKEIEQKHESGVKHFKNMVKKAGLKLY